MLLELRDKRPLQFIHDMQSRYDYCEYEEKKFDLNELKYVIEQLHRRSVEPILLPQVGEDYRYKTIHN